MTARPLLLLDVDGPLNPYRAKTTPPGYERHEIVEGTKTWVVLLNQRHGVELNALADHFQLVWATSWEHGANRLLAPRLGLPTDLPVIVWPAGARDAVPGQSRPGQSRPGQPHPGQPHPGSWKTPHIADWVAGRSFAWIDDEVNRHDRAYLAGLDGVGRHLVHRVEAHRGLVRADFEAVREWARSRPQ